MKYDDAENYLFHQEDVDGICFSCVESAPRLLIVRHVESNMLVHLCPDCMIASGSEYLLDNTRPWLDTGRIESGTSGPQLVSLSLASIISRSIEKMDTLCRKRGLSLESHIQENMPPIIGSEGSLLRVFANIIGNAAKYTPENGSIIVTAQHDDHYITASVSDTGIGIPNDKLPFIFEPFFRARGKDEIIKTSRLGLTLCKRVVESHHGVISVSSKEGEGTTFVLKFPVPIRPAKQKEDGS